MPAQLPWSPGDDLFVVVDAQERVTVTSVDPDTGATLDSAENVRAFDVSHRQQSASAGGGEVPDWPSTFFLHSADLGFVPKPRDDVYRDDGTHWSILDVGVEAFGPPGGFYVVRTIRVGY